ASGSRVAPPFRAAPRFAGDERCAKPEAYRNRGADSAAIVRSWLALGAASRPCTSSATPVVSPVPTGITCVLVSWRLDEPAPFRRRRGPGDHVDRARGPGLPLGDQAWRVLLRALRESLLRQHVLQ